MYNHSAATHEGLASLKSWYLAGANVNEGDYDKRTALHAVGNPFVLERERERDVYIKCIYIYIYVCVCVCVCVCIKSFP